MLPKTKKDIVFVGAQFLLFIAFILKFKIFIPELYPTSSRVYLWPISVSIFVMSILQLNKNLSPFPSPKTDSILVTHGIFKYIRHPIYTAIILGMLVWSLYQHSLYQLIISFLIFDFILF